MFKIVGEGQYSAMRHKITKFALALGSLGAVIWVLLQPHDYNLPQSSTPPERIEATSTGIVPRRQSSSVPGLEKPVGSWKEYDSMMRGVIGIDEYILKHLRLAEAGNANSAYYVSEAMIRCATELISFRMSYDTYSANHGADHVGPEEMMTVVLGELVGYSEFYLEQVRHSLMRAIECKKLGWESQYLYDESVQWQKRAIERNQVVALVQAARLDPSNPPDNPDQIEASRKTMREALSQSQDLVVLLNASTVVSASTGSDFPLERLSWALTACEYQRCDSLNHLYRDVCESMSMHGSAICTNDMTDLDYLFLKYPELFDLAQARAKEIKQAIESEDWRSLGLD